VTKRKSPKRAANELTALLRTVLGEDRFPVDVEQLAIEVSNQQEDPITKIKRVDIDGFDGMLRAHRNKPGWHILYNGQTDYPGRERFTLAHEFGHYMLHRRPLKPEFYSTGKLPDGFDFECLPLQSNQWKDFEKEPEEEADTFASYLLMPIDDYRIQVSGEEMTLGLLKHVTSRYGVSLLAVARKWIEFTDKKAAMIVARDDFALWGRASDAAFKDGVFIRPGMPIPNNAIAALGPEANLHDNGNPTSVPAGVWKFSRGSESVRDLTVFSERLGMSVTILQFDDDTAGADIGEERSWDSYDQFRHNSR